MHTVTPSLQPPSPVAAPATAPASVSAATASIASRCCSYRSSIRLRRCSFRRRRCSSRCHTLRRHRCTHSASRRSSHRRSLSRRRSTPSASRRRSAPVAASTFAFTMPPRIYHRCLLRFPARNLRYASTSAAVPPPSRSCSTTLQSSTPTSRLNTRGDCRPDFGRRLEAAA